MSDLIKYPTSASSLVTSRAERAAAREIERVRLATDLACALKNAEIDVIESVTHSALLATAHLSALEGLSAGARTPRRKRRLRHVADGGCMAMADAVMRPCK